MSWNIRHGQRGFSLLELTVVICLIAILVALAADRLGRLRVEAERVAMLQVVGSIQSAMGIELARRVVRGGLQFVAELDGSNPMDLLSKQPENYLGELRNVGLETLPPASWYYDAEQRVLIYIVKNTDYFATPLQGVPRARFRFQLDYQDRDGNGAFESGTDDLGGFRLVAIEDFRWLSQTDIREQIAR